MTNLLTLKEAAARIGIAEHTLRVWRTQGRGPAGFKTIGGNRVMYRPEVVDQWLADQEAATSSNSSAQREGETRPRLAQSKIADKGVPREVEP